jgi:hypothetical protein
MAITLKITRTLLALGDLDLIASGGYEVISDGLTMGEVSQRQDWAKSAYVSGGALMSTIDDIVQSSVQVEVYGSSRADLRTKVTTLMAAFKQTYYTLTWDLDGSSYAWLCYKANRKMDSNFPFYLGNLTVCTFTFQRQPDPQSGPF